jgi:integrase
MGKRGDVKREASRRKRGNGEGSVRPTSRGWVGAISLGKDAAGKQIRKFIQRQTQGEVIQELRALRRKQETNQPITSTKRTVGSFFTEWLEDHVKPNRSPNTYQSYEQHVRMYIVPLLGKVVLERLNGQDVQRFINKLRTLSADARQGRQWGGKGMKPSRVEVLTPATIQRVHATLRSGLTTAMRWGFVFSNAAKNASAPPQEKYKAKPLTQSQGLKLLDSVIGHRYEAITTIGLSLGLRRGEVAGLKWTSIDFITGRMDITHQLSRVKKIGVVYRRLKTRSSMRSIQLPPFCVDALKRRRSMQEGEQKLSGKKWKDTGFVFTSKDGNFIMPEFVTVTHTEALKEAGLPHVRFHDLRHTAATLLLAKKVPMKAVQEILGHSSFQITMELYGHVVVEQREAATDAMERMFGDAQRADVGPIVGLGGSTRIQ